MFIGKEGTTHEQPLHASQDGVGDVGEGGEVSPSIEGVRRGAWYTPFYQLAHLLPSQGMSDKYQPIVLVIAQPNK